MSSNGRVTWTNEQRRLGDLQPWPRNPRQIKTDQAKRLVESFDQFGQVETIAIGPDGEIYNGHQRLNVLMQQYGADYEVDCRQSSRPLTEKEREKLTVFLHKGAAGEWDFDVLANEFEVDELLEWGFNQWEIGVGDIIGADSDSLTEKRTNNNFSMIGAGNNIAINFGEIMATLPGELYKRTLDYVKQDQWGSIRAGISSLLERGLDAEISDS